MNSKKPIVVITGASSGIGKLISIKLAKKKYQVIIIARSINKLLKIKQQIEINNDECIAVQADLRNPEEINKIISRINNPEDIEVLINNAGIGIYNRIQDISINEWDDHMNTNLRGAFLVTKLVLPYMIKKKTGKILFINSVAGISPYPFASAYVASKYGLRGLAASLREELREYNIKVISIHPGAIHTPFWDKSGSDFPRDEMMSARDVANMIIQTIIAPNNLVCEEIIMRRTKGDF